MLNEKYKALVKHILDNGSYEVGRNGCMLIVPHYSFTLDFRSEEHMLSLRKMYYKGVNGEFKTLISNQPLTNVCQFKENGCNYWDDWAGPNGELNLDYWNKLHPQLEDVFQALRQDPHSRRHVIELWDHENVKNGKLSLPCCWHGMTFTVVGNVLHMTWVQRSVDTMVGLPSDIYLAYQFMRYMAGGKFTIGSCMFALSNVHIYEEHIDGAKELLTRAASDYNKPLKFELKA